MLPAGVEVSKRVGDVAAHGDHDGPLAAQVLDEDGRQEHGGQDDGSVDDAQRGHAHPCLRIQAALQGEQVGRRWKMEVGGRRAGNGGMRWREVKVEGKMGEGEVVRRKRDRGRGGRHNIRSWREKTQGDMKAGGELIVP